MDITKIAGYEEGMSAEELLELVKAYEPDMSEYVRKAVADKYASEAAEAKRKLKERMTAEELKAAEDAEKTKGLLEELETLRTERSIGNHVEELMAQGYDKETAKEAAKAIVSGDMMAYFGHQKKFLEDQRKSWEAERMKGAPRPEGGGDPKSNPAEEFAASLGKQRAESVKQTAEILKKY